MDESYEISHHVRSALVRNVPVVALESAVIAHGLPGGAGVEAARSMAEKVESEGCTPAVIGIVGGRITIGLSEDEIRRLGEGRDVLKVSTRELADAVLAKRDGAATVAATAYLASNAGIPVMATGGTGGVHRGASQSWDISPDLWELARTPEIVVCSGAKAVLDIPATLEWLETHQIAVFGYGTDEFPAFYTPRSGLSVPRLDKPEDAAEMYVTRLGLGLRSAMIVAVPIRKKDAVDVQEATDKAVAAARNEAISGPALTPWLLARVQELSGGAAVAANLSLLANNARVAAKIAAALIGRREKRIGFTA